MPNFKLLLQTFKEEQFSKTLNDIGIKSWKLLLVDYTKTFDFAAGVSLGADFIIFVDPEDGITYYDIDKAKLKVISFLGKMEELYSLEELYSFRIETIDSFKTKYLSRKLLAANAIEEILKKADTLDNLYDKVFGVNKAAEVLPATAGAAADNVNAPSSPTAADTSVVADSSSKVGLFSSASKASSDTSSANVLLERAFLDYMQKLAPDIRQKRLAEINKILNFDAKDIANIIRNTPSCS